jgi:RimJ/RimL family protein N-acetyltransferase
MTTPAHGDRVIATARLELRTMSAGFLDAVVVGDYARAGTIGGCTLPDAWSARDRAHALRRLAQLRADPARDVWLTRAIVRREDGVLVGRVGFHDRPGSADLQPWCPGTDGGGTVEIGYAVFAPYRRRGYASEAAAGLIAWAERRHGVTQVVASVSPTNTASLRTIARLGFVRVGERMDDEDGRELVFLRPAGATDLEPPP